jgi:hypothetical protein
MTPIGASCRSCGAPLSNKGGNGFAPQTGALDQPEVPAWLESLRVGERPAAPASNPTSFSPADLIEEGALPSWMRNERERTNSQAAIPNPMAYSEQPESNSVFPSPGLDASSLIDEKALPSWMQEEKVSPGKPPSSPGSFSAGSLVQPENLPEWMKTLQQKPAQSQQSQAPAQSPLSAGFPVPPAASGQGFSARDLLDPQSLPSWMQSIGTSGTTGAHNASALSANTGSNDYGSRSRAINTDDAANAAWNSKPDQGTPALPDAQQKNGQTSFSASSLLDMDSLPQWLREQGNQSGAPSVQPSGQPSWQNGPAPSPVQSAMQTPPTTPVSQQEGNRVSASSFIDMNALPNWLRSADQPAQGGNVGMGSGSSYNANASSPNMNIPGVTPRAENMRVPSRPRNEVNASETSELAANVFASMLGVASSTPNFPAQQSPAKPPTNTQQPPYQPQQPSQANAYGMMSQAGQGYNANPDPYSQLSQSKTNIPNPNLGASLAGNGNIPNSNLGASLAGNGNIPNSNLGASLSGNGNIPNPLAVPNTPASMNDPLGQNTYTNAASSSYNGIYGGFGQGQGNSPYGAGRAAGSGQSNTALPASGIQAPAGSTDDQKSSKKRGIFEAIRDWLSR